MRRAPHAPHALHPTGRMLATGLSAVLVLSVVTACNDDGRTLPPAKPEQTASVSTATTSVAPTIDQLDDGSTHGPAHEVEIQTAWASDGIIPIEHTCDGDNFSPPVSWTDVPEGTVEIAISLVDDTRRGHDAQVLWVVAGISSDTLGLEAGMIPLGAVEAVGASDSIGYSGPCPAAGTESTVTLTVHFLETPSGLSDGDPGPSALDAITQSELFRISLKGSFSRP